MPHLKIRVYPKYGHVNTLNNKTFYVHAHSVTKVSALFAIHYKQCKTKPKPYRHEYKLTCPQ